jgi:GxxExxY protein
MHPLFAKASSLTESIIGGAIEVHRDKGPGLIESIYKWCLLKELEIRKLDYICQKSVEVHCKGFTRQEPLRFDMLIEDCVLVESKSVHQVLPIHKAQLLSYMRLMNIPIGLLINFNELRVIDGVHRLLLPGANPPEDFKQEETEKRDDWQPITFTSLMPIPPGKPNSSNSTPSLPLFPPV